MLSTFTEKINECSTVDKIRFLKESPQAAFVFVPALYLFFSSLYLLWRVMKLYFQGQQMADFGGHFVAQTLYLYSYLSRFCICISPGSICCSLLSK